MASQFFESVLFDMDGLTINSEPEWLEAEREVTASFGYTWTKEDQAHCLGGPLHKVGEYMSKVTNSSEPGDYFHKKLVDLMTEKITISASFMPGAKELI